jgi:hypothetical protein
MHTRLSVTCLFASLLVGLSPNALAIPTKPGGSVTQLFRAPLNDRPGTDVAVIRVDYPPGGSTPPHEHPGFVFAYVAGLRGSHDPGIPDDSREVLRREGHVEIWTVTRNRTLVPGIPRHYVRTNPVNINDAEASSFDEGPDGRMVSVRNRAREPAPIFVRRKSSTPDF